MFALPPATPYATPLVAFIVVIAALLVLHVPPTVPVDNATLLPTQ